MMETAESTDKYMIMKIRTGVFCFFWALISIFSPLKSFGEERVHTVQRGETFYSIARSFDLKADDLMKYNGISDPSQLKAGQKLKIPSLSAPAATGSNSAVAAAPAGGSTANYRVIRGDTLYSIAKKFSVTVASLQAMNGLAAGHVLKVGDSLKVPGGTGPAGPRPQEAVPAASSLRWPVAVRELNYMTGKLSGVVITGTRTEAVESLTHGTVLSAGPYRGFGNVAIIQVEGNYLYVYGGCESLTVKEGDKVGPGSELGKLGVDAVTNKPQLFFMVYRSNVPVDPAKAPRA